MSSKKNIRPVKIKFNELTWMFELKIGKLLLESDDIKIFTLRLNEVQKLYTSYLPDGYKFIVYDETLNPVPHLVNVKIILERSGIDHLNITVEESSLSSRWNDENSSNEYFMSRLDLVSKRQKDIFDVIIGTHQINGRNLFLQYTIEMGLLDGQRLLNLLIIMIRAIHISSDNFNFQDNQL